MNGADNSDQVAFWSEEAGPKWVAHQRAMDALLQPVLDLVLDRAALRPGQSVLDIGCGAGASTRAAAARVAPAGHVTGVDVSATLLAHARTMGGENLSYAEADAQTHRFDDHDALISRFGVMFFSDTTAAFANLRASLRPGARITCAAWGPAPQNPYFMLPAAAARDVLGPQPKTDRRLPGPFAWEEADRVAAMLKAAGLRDVMVEPVPLSLRAGNPEETAELALRIGPAEAALRRAEADDAARAALREALVAGLAGLVDTGGRVNFPALINLVTATA